MAKFHSVRFVMVSLALVTYAHSQPNRVNISIVSQQIAAGDTIAAVIRISDNGGLISGTFCAPAVYQDIVNSLPSQPRPVIIVDGNAYSLKHYPDTSISINQCFSNGIDTIKIVLFNAPYSGDSLHQLLVSIGNIGSSSEPFRVSPSELKRIQIKGFGGESAPDTVSLPFSVAQYILSAIGYDAYGNKIGFEMSHWFTTGSLPKIGENSAHTISAFFGDAQAPAEGFLFAKSVRDSSLSDSVWIMLKSPAIARTGKPAPNSSTTIHLSFRGNVASIDISGIAPPYPRISLYDLSGKTLFITNLKTNHVDMMLPSLQTQFLVLSMLGGNGRVENHSVFLVKP